MKKLKLEVGKTYRSREGKEVGIVRAIYSRIWPFCGDNGKSYNEQGRCYSVNLDDSEDLIEEVPETQHTFALVAGALTANRYVFNIPEDVKRVTVSQEGSRIIVEMVPEKGPKAGDVMVNEHGSVYVFKAATNNNYHNHFAWLAKPGRLFIDYGCCAPGRPATPEEAKPLWDALKKAGKRWNPETMVVEDVPESDRIREWVERHFLEGHYTQDNISEVIEAYSNYKEAKNNKKDV